jgi:hypothetical protein
MWRIEQVVEFLKALAQRDASLRSFSVGGGKNIFSRIPVRMEG